MSGTLIALVVQVIAGIIGGHAAGQMKNFDLGSVGNTIAGAIGGAGGGQLLAMLVPALAGAAGGGVDLGSIAGQLIGGGAGGAILTAIGLPEWIADDNAGYVDLAVKFASSPDDLRTMRHALLARIEGSVAGNPAAYTRAVEEAYRAFWRRYCASVDDS